jgi:hypothetical protein
MQILPNAAYLQRSCRTGASERVAYNRQYWRQLGNNRGTKLPPTMSVRAAKICAAVWLFRTRGPRRPPVCITRHDERWFCNENCPSTCRGAFTPKHRWLHQHASTADGDEGVIAGLLEWGVGGGPVTRRPFFWRRSVGLPLTCPAYRCDEPSIGCRGSGFGRLDRLHFAKEPSDNSDANVVGSVG